MAEGSENTSVAVTRRNRPFNITITNSPPLVKFDYDTILPQGKLLGLYQTIKNTLPPEPCHIVQFASAYHGEGTNVIAFETALTAAMQIGMRVLFIDTSSPPGVDRMELASHLDTTLDVLLQAGGKLENAQVGIEDTHFVYTALRNHKFRDSALAHMDNFRELLNILRGMYDLIVIPAPCVLTDVLCASLSRLTDGTLIIVEAERTRAPVLAQVKEIVTQNGGRIIGAIMNKRRLYIPKWLYRWI